MALPFDLVPDFIPIAAPDFSQQVAGLGTYAFKDLGWRNALVIAEDNEVGLGGATAFLAEFGQGRRQWPARGARLSRGEPRWGRIRLDSNRAAIVSTNVLSLGGIDLQEVHVVRTVPEVDQSLGGVLPATYEPTSGEQPCRAGTPPPWAR